MLKMILTCVGGSGFIVCLAILLYKYANEKLANKIEILNGVRLIIVGLTMVVVSLWAECTLL